MSTALSGPVDVALVSGPGPSLLSRQSHTARYTELHVRSLTRWAAER